MTATEFVFMATIVLVAPHMSRRFVENLALMALCIGIGATLWGWLA